MTGELCPPAALSRKWFAQRTQVLFRHHFHDALHAIKFLGEKCGLEMSSRNRLAPRFLIFNSRFLAWLLDGSSRCQTSVHGTPYLVDGTFESL